MDAELELMSDEDIAEMEAFFAVDPADFDAEFHREADDTEIDDEIPY